MDPANWPVFVSKQVEASGMVLLSSATESAAVGYEPVPYPFRRT